MCACICPCTFTHSYICLSVCGQCVCRCSQRPEEGVRSSGAGITDNCEPLEHCAGNWPQVLCRSRICLCSPDWPKTCHLSASAPWGLELQICTTMPSFKHRLLRNREVLNRQFHLLPLLLLLLWFSSLSLLTELPLLSASYLSQQEGQENLDRNVNYNQCYWLKAHRRALAKGVKATQAPGGKWSGSFRHPGALHSNRTLDF